MGNPAFAVGSTVVQRNVLGGLGQGDWEVVPWTWRATCVVHLMESGRPFFTDP